MALSARLLRRASALAAALALVAAPAAAAAADQGRGAGAEEIRLIAFNDLHGNLEPPSGSSGRVTLSDGSTVEAGGAAYLATHVRRLREQSRASVVLSGGDNIGASPLASALFHDEPTIELLNQLGVSASAVGNHELDEGYRELRRVQHGGCHPVDGCRFRPDFRGARWPYLAANMTFADSGLPAAAPFTVTWVRGVPVGVIGLPLEGTPSVVSADAVKGLRFAGEVETINRYADLLDRMGVRSIVVLLHQGDNTEGGGPNDCRTTPGPARLIAEKVTPKVDVVFTGHSHQQYVCTVTDPAGQPRPMVQGASFGRILSVVDVRVDRRTRDVIRPATRAFNQVVTRDVPADRAVEALVGEARAKSAPIANERVGAITADVPRSPVASGESPLGNLLADAQVEATKGANARIALMNPGGVRADLVFASSGAGEGDGVVTYGEAYAVQPFGNILQTLTLTGAQLKAVLEQQWQTTPDGKIVTRVLQPSAGLRYTWSASAPVGSKVSGLTIDGQPVLADAKYRVTVNNFLAGGGDGFTELTKGTEVTGGAVDLDAFLAYLRARPGVAPPPTDRISVAA